MQIIPKFWSAFRMVPNARWAWWNYSGQWSERSWRRLSAVFAPEVFRSIVDLCRPYLEGTDAFDRKEEFMTCVGFATIGHLQGAARHVISAFEIALVDAHSKSLEKPARQLFTDSPDNSIRAYGSGGICDTKEHFAKRWTCSQN